MARFKGATIQPQIHLNDGEVRYAQTYRELKKKLREAINDNNGEAVVVYRSRRGEWGEWYEYWSLNDNDMLCLTKKGWS